MASKKFKGKFCVYGCHRLATTPDHVFAREFFLPGTSYEPIKVPACVQCNNEKSQLEHYLTALLPFGGRHRDASLNLEQMVPKRLARNAKLHRLLSEHKGTTWVKDNGDVYVPTMTLPVDFHKTEQLFKFITMGLIWHYWQVRLTAAHFITVLALSQHGEQEFDRKFFRVNHAAHVSNDLGQGTFIYEGVQGVDNPEITVWRFSIYGGLTLGGDPRAPDEGSSVIGVMTGPKRVFNNAVLRARFEPGI